MRHGIVYMLASIILFLAATMHAVELRLIGAKNGSNDGDRFGDACEGIGDINGDGFMDFLTTSFGSRELYLYLGNTSPFDSDPVATLQNYGTASGIFSFSPVNIGDIDCDGTSDFVALIEIGHTDTLKIITGLENLDFGESHIIKGDTGGWNWSVLAGGGDNNVDGRADFWFHYYDRLDSTIFGYYGCELFDTVPDHQIIMSLGPDSKYRTLSRSLCATCDINGDSIPDIIYGQRTGDPAYPGRVCIVWGGSDIADTAELVFYAPTLDVTPHSFGVDLACLNYISGDGYDDLWVSQGNRNYIFYGGPSFDTIPNVSLDYTWILGGMTENVGDVNNDGYDDIALVWADYLFSYVSFLYCYPGMDTLVDVIISDADFRNYLSQGPLSNVGIDISRGGDIDGDGIDDVLISARETDDDQWDNGWLLILAGWDDPTDVPENNSANILDVIDLGQNYPNPFNSGTQIEFTLPRSGHAVLSIYNIIGQLVATPVDAHLRAGDHQINWDGRDNHGNLVATGVYFYELVTETSRIGKKMMILK